MLFIAYDKVISYPTYKSVTLGEFTKMTDDEIIETISENGDILPQEFCVAVYTDETGNTVWQESICWKDERSDKYAPPYGAVYKLEGAFDNHSVYDAVYNGYKGDCDYNNASWYGIETDFFFVTKIDPGEIQGFALDSINIDGILIDPSDEEVLNALN